MHNQINSVYMFNLLKIKNAHIIDIDRIWYRIRSQPREISSEHGELMIYRWCLKEINRPLDLQVSLAPLINYNARVNSRLCSGQTTPTGPRAAALSWRIYAAPFPNAFIIPRCQRLAFSLVFVLLLSPRSSGSPPSFSLSPRLLPNSRPSTLHNTHEHHHSAHSRSHPSPPSFFSPPSLPFATRQWFLFVFGIHVLHSPLPRLFFYIIGAALFGLGRKRPHIETTLRRRVVVILYNACNGCCDAPPDTPLSGNVIYEGGMITRANVDDPSDQFA